MSRIRDWLEARYYRGGCAWATVLALEDAHTNWLVNALDGRSHCGHPYNGLRYCLRLWRRRRTLARGRA